MHMHMHMHMSHVHVHVMVSEIRDAVYFTLSLPKLLQDRHRVVLRDEQCYREIKRTVRHDDERQRAATALKEEGEEAPESLVEKQERCAVAARRAV